MPASTPVGNVATNKDYQRLLDILAGEGGGGSAVDAYSRLMATERRVLDTVDRIVNEARTESHRRRLFTQMSLSEILDVMQRTLRQVFEEVMRARHPRDVWQTVSKMDRRICLGLVLVFAAVTIMVVEATSSLPRE